MSDRQGAWWDEESSKSVNREQGEPFEEDDPAMLCLFKLMTLTLVDVSLTHTNTDTQSS